MGILSLRRQILMATPHQETAVGDPVATFQTDVVAPAKVTIPFAPAQDLNGMPYPYPAGASVNLIPDTEDTNNGYVSGYYLASDGTTTSNANLYISEYFPIDENTTYTWSNRANSATNPSICFYDGNKTFISGIAINQQYSHTFTPPAGAVYARSSQSTYAFQESNPTGSAYQLEVGSTATEYRRYSNICPIVGWTGCNITAAQENLLKPSSSNFVKFIGSPKLNADTGVITSSSSTCQGGVVLPVIEGKTYTWRFTRLSGGTSYGRVAVYSEYPTSWDNQTKRILYSNSMTSNGTRNDDFTVRSGEKYLYIGMYKSSGANVFSFGDIYVGWTSRSYVAPNIRTFPVSWQTEAGTVYGGTLTINEDGSADLVGKYQLLDGGDVQTWTKITNNNYRNFAFTWSRAEQNNQTVTVWSDHYRGVATNSGSSVDGDNYVWMRAKSGSGSSAQPQQCCVKDTGHASLTATQFKTLMTGVKFLGLLKEEYWTTTHFDNIGQLHMYLGENNIWSDLNDVPTVDYWKHN